jgi:hypothetical protein
MLLLVIASGCGKKSNLPPLAPVSGTIKVDGQPLERGMIAFVPDMPQPGAKTPMGSSPIGKAGQYRIKTAGEDGAWVGPHRIRVMAETEYDPVTNTPPMSFVNRKYASEQSSGLTREVVADTDNVFDFDLDGP